MEDSYDPGPEGLLALLQAGSLPVVYIIAALCLLLLLISALVSGSEVAFFSLSPQQLDTFKSSQKTSDKRVFYLLSRPKHLLATILILNNLVNVAIVTLATYATWQLVGRDNHVALLYLTLAVTSAIVFFGEILPKVFATQKNLSFARFTSGVLVFAETMLRPFSWLLTSLGDTLEKRLKAKGFQVSLLEIYEAVEMATESGTTENERDILKGIVDFSTKTARQIMCSRIHITAFDIETDFHELMDKINKNGYSRIPVYEDTIDRIVGILYIKDLIPHLDQDEHFKWQELMRQDVFFVPENKKIDGLLKDFQHKRVHMAIVVDEYGGTSGLVTLEDIIEEIIGEINDEFDTEENVYRKIDEATYTFEGKITLNDFCKLTNIDPLLFAEAKGESESLGGLLLELFGKFPNVGEQIDFGNFVFTAVSVSNKRIKSVRVFIKDRAETRPSTTQIGMGKPQQAVSKQ